MRLPPFTGCVLTGGRSTRMGSDKATLDHHGAPLAAVPVRALRDAGADRVFCLGGDHMALAAAGLDAIPDRLAGSGPLAAILQALDTADNDVVVVLACDLPRASSASVTATVRALVAPHLVAMPTYGGRPQYLHAAYHRDVRAALHEAFDAGTRSIHAALADVPVATVSVADPTSLADADQPADLE